MWSAPERFLVEIGWHYVQDETVALRPDQCPSDSSEVAQAYVMGTLSDGDAAAFEVHLLICAGWRAAVGTADMDVRAMQDAVRGVREAE
jgi:hypothetical protein